MFLARLVRASRFIKAWLCLALRPERVWVLPISGSSRAKNLGRRLRNTAKKTMRIFLTLPILNLSGSGAKSCKQKPTRKHRRFLKHPPIKVRETRGTGTLTETLTQTRLVLAAQPADRTAFDTLVSPYLPTLSSPCYP